MPVIYMAEDDPALNAELSKLLGLNGYEVVCCECFVNAADEVRSLNPDLVILDLNLGEIDGRSICRSIRQGSHPPAVSPTRETSLNGQSAPYAPNDVPIIVLTSASDEFTEVMSLNLGADDFINKPYRPAVLLARIASLIKRHDQSSHNGAVIEYAGVSLDASSSKVAFGGSEVLLTRNEQRILSLLMRNPETIISRQELMCDLWESDAFIDDNTLTVNVNRLRKQLASIGVPNDFLQTRRSLGYIVTRDF